MTARIKYSIVLVFLGGLLAFLPISANRSLIVKPEKLLLKVLDEESYYTVDQVARFALNEDSSIQIIDIRSAEEYLKANIPGSANIPYSDFLEEAPGIFLNNKSTRYILYSDGDILSNYAFTLAQGMNCQNTYVMRGGLNDWYKTIMNSSFKGEKITARENALFEIRNRAGKLFNDLNSLPDSMKIIYMESKRLEAKKLDGGCE